MVDFESPAEYDFLEEDDSLFDPETGELMLGNIVISKEKVILQAEEYGHSEERERTYLIVHGLLHLFGYDHIDEEDRKEMRAKEKEVMRLLGSEEE